MIKKLVKLILIVLWMGLIFSFSQEDGTKSTSKSDKVILKIYKSFNKEKLTEKEQKEIIDKFVFPIRKAAHFSEYLILGILIISFISEFKALEIKYLILAIFISMLYAISDEIHQLFVSGRSARVFDVVIDTLGATTGIYIYNFIKNKIRIITE